MLKIAICDDEKNVCDYIEKRVMDFLAKADSEGEATVFYDSAPLIEFCKENPSYLDIIFLDIKMKTVNGVDCAKQLRDLGVEALIVFVTSSAEYVFSGYEVKAFRYILKTDLVNAFDRIFGECLNELSKADDSFYTVKTASAVKNIPLNDIFYFESNKRVLIVHTKNDEYSFYGKLDAVEKELEGKDFIRTHQSYLVNAKKIKSVSKDSAELLNGELLPVSKSKASAVKNAYLWAKR
ncbi:MAG: response regulator transcription factor [Clostridia bacterium]|nr:response regulator transcription factor [Clostridia bacterium]